jgi:DNA-binding MarR family transcriptional regulator
MRRSRANAETNPRVFQELAQFRYRIRRFLRFSEQAARGAGVTPQQHQLMLGVAGFTGRGWANISELAEFLQERHNAVVELVARASRAGLVTKQLTADDRRVVRVELTPRGQSILMRLSALHRKELRSIRNGRQEPLLSSIDGHSRRGEAGNVHKTPYTDGR